MLTRRRLLAASLASVAGAYAARPGAAASIGFHTRRRTAAGPIEQSQALAARQTLIIICDMWDDHYCRSSVRRLEALVPRMNQTLDAARALGVHVIHAPSGTMDFYRDAPQRLAMQAVEPSKPPVPIERWCYLDPKSEAALPIDDAEACDDEVPRAKVRFYNREHPGLVIAPQDGISDDGQEIYNYCAREGVKNVLLMGVHANMCVLGRPFGIRQQTRLGMNVMLVRDLTDAMYDPRDRPYVTHEQGTQLVIEHIERFWCPTVLSQDLIDAAGAVSD
ncbi:MAG: isochorismatase family protein [Acidobacteria bacterium]|nr:isochorismatase family protein [Acidobacteriota bacterium]